MKPSLLSPRQRVVITGLGVVAPSGTGKQNFWNAVVEGRSGVDWIRNFDVSDLYCKVAGQVRDFDPTDYLEGKLATRTARYMALAVAASKLALQDAGVDAGKFDPYRLGAIFGTTNAGIGNVTDELYVQLHKSGHRGMDLVAPSQTAAHAVTAQVAISLGFKGHNTTSGAGCASALDAIAQGMAALQSGRAQVMVVGGSDATISFAGMSAFCAQRVVTRHNDPPSGACRPYDKTRDGIVVSEGAGSVVLETAAQAMDRGAPIYAEVMGFAMTGEAHHLLFSKPDGEELARAFRAALLQAKIGADEVDYVCAHGVANREYDAGESNAVKMVLGPRAYHVPMSSIKSSTGQPFSAGGAWQAVASCMALQTGIVPPTINLREPDPECDLDYVPNYARRTRVETVMMNSHSVGGTHGCLILRKFE